MRLCMKLNIVLATVATLVLAGCAQKNIAAQTAEGFSEVFTVLATGKRPEELAKAKEDAIKEKTPIFQEGIVDGKYVDISKGIDKNLKLSIDAYSLSGSHTLELAEQSFQNNLKKFFDEMKPGHSGAVADHLDMEPSSFTDSDKKALDFYLNYANAPEKAKKIIIDTHNRNLKRFHDYAEKGAEFSKSDRLIRMVRRISIGIYDPAKRAYHLILTSPSFGGAFPPDSYKKIQAFSYISNLKNTRAEFVCQSGKIFSLASKIGASWALESKEPSAVDVDYCLLDARIKLLVPVPPEQAIKFGRLGKNSFKVEVYSKPEKMADVARTIPAIFRKQKKNKFFNKKYNLPKNAKDKIKFERTPLEIVGIKVYFVPNG